MTAYSARKDDGDVRTGPTGHPGGGWGEKALQCRLTPMTCLDIGDGQVVTDRETIATAATEYDQKLFDIQPHEDDEERTKHMIAVR